MSDEPLPLVRPEEAIATLKAKGYAIGFDWRDIWQEEHARAFTVAKAMSRDLLEDIREAVTSALEEGTTLESFIRDLRPRLVARGWWGRALMTDPAGGVEKLVRLGSPARLRTIYQTNLRTSYMAGRWQRIEKAKRLFPFLRYVSVKDGREREEHGAWHDTILPVDDPWWDTHFPPCGWNCRCDAQPLNRRMLDRRDWEVNEPPRFPERDYVNRRTGEVVRLERGIDPGWSYNVGKASLDGLTPSPRLRPATGEQGELQAALSEGDFDRLRSFFAPFGLMTRAAAAAGRVFIDKAGWPLAISAGLFRRADGEIAAIGDELAPGLAAAARVLTDPDRIGWLWIAGRDGKAMLVRRYQRVEGSVDIGGKFWRWLDGKTGQRARGRLLWTREEGVLAGFDPHKHPRHPGGGSNGGQFRDTGRTGARAALSGAIEPGDVKSFKSADMGGVPSECASMAAKSGIELASDRLRLVRSPAVHILKDHGPSAARAKGERAMSGKDILSFGDYLARSHSVSRGKRGAQGEERVVFETNDRKGGAIRIIAVNGRKGLSLYNMFQPVPNARQAKRSRNRR